MLKLNTVLVFSENPDIMTDFYKKVFNSEVGWSNGQFVGFAIGNNYLVIGPHDKVKGNNINPERIIFQFEADDVQTEFERLKKIGARVVAPPYQPGEDKSMWLATLADPDGNYFQLASPMN
jgi:predicted enzyme related to lactoylglutathione lyase